MIQTRSKYELLSWEKYLCFRSTRHFCPLSIYFFLYYSKSRDLTVSLCFIIIIAVSQQLFLLFVLSSWQTLTSASKASSFCLTVNRWNSASTSPRSSALFFHWQTICSGLQVSCWSVPSRTFGHDVSRTILLPSASPMRFHLVGEAAWCFCCVVSPQRSTVWSAYLVFMFLLIASITLLYQRLFLFSFSFLLNG